MAMRWEAFLDQVEERGAYGTSEEAERAARMVLALMGAHLVGEVVGGTGCPLEATASPMIPQQEPRRSTVGMTFEQMLERVRYEGAYTTRAQAEVSVRAVLAALGRQLTGDERVELAARLAHEAAVTLTSEIPAT
ncbi:DUF2267 domain-containing protein [Streptomyces sp. NPDC007971]|uniref:DUF2267 domain-containing protein n=1 Tax=Streptomyces sp. NPDC007971 TaxID=3364799 RepID=UPI0036EB7CA9